MRLRIYRLYRHHAQGPWGGALPVQTWACLSMSPASQLIKWPGEGVNFWGEILRQWKWHIPVLRTGAKHPESNLSQGFRLQKTDQGPYRVLLSQIPRGTCAGLSPSPCEFNFWGGSRIPVKHGPSGHLLTECHDHYSWRRHQVPCRAGNAPKSCPYKNGRRNVGQCRPGKHGQEHVSTPYGTGKPRQED